MKIIPSNTGTAASEFRQAVRYLIAGGLTTLLNFAAFTFLYELLDINVNISNIISIAAAVIFAYFINKIYVFHSKSPDLRSLFREFLKFTGGRLATMHIEVLGVFLLVSIIGIYALIGKLVAQIIVVIGNYFISRYIVFTEKNRQ